MEKISNFILVGIIGMLLGAGIATGVWYTSTATTRAELKQYKSLLADRDRSIASIDRQLREAQAMVREHSELNAEIARQLREGITSINAAKSDYERGITSLKLVARVYDTLRRYYDPTYKGTEPQKP